LWPVGLFRRRCHYEERGGEEEENSTQAKDFGVDARDNSSHGEGSQDPEARVWEEVEGTKERRDPVDVLESAKVVRGGNWGWNNGIYKNVM